MRKRHTTQYPGIMFRVPDENRPKDNRRYIVFYTDANKKRHTETMPVGSTLEDARLLRDALLRKKRTHVPTRRTVGQLLDEYMELRKHSLKAKTYEDYTWGTEIVKRHCGDLELRALTASHIAGLIIELQKRGLKTWTIKKILTPLSGATRVAVREGWIQTNPMQNLLPHEMPKGDQREMRTMSSEEIRKLLGAASNRRWCTLFSTLVMTGLRISEALALEWKDVNLETGFLTVRISKTKAGERNVMIIPMLKSLLAAHKLSQTVGTEFVFGGHRRPALGALRDATKRASLPDYTLHELRHTFASILIAQGELPTFVASQMGHANPAVTMRIYAHLFEKEESTDRARERLQAVFGGMV